MVKLLKYFDMRLEAVILYKKSDMIHAIYIDASYLYKKKLSVQ